MNFNHNLVFHQIILFKFDDDDECISQKYTKYQNFRINPKFSNHTNETETAHNHDDNDLYNNIIIDTQKALEPNFRSL